MKNTKQTWTEFKTDSDIVAKYLVVGDDLRFDVRIKIVTPMPRGYYHSAVNDAGLYYDKNIYPKLTQGNQIK